MTRIVVVTGTDTGVGKTIATAALAATSPGRTLVVKPVQTGIGGSAPDTPDVEVVARLSGVETVQLVALDEPLAPEAAARRQGRPLPTVADHADRIRDLAASYDLVLVEGAGGLLVRLDTAGGTLLDLADALRAEVVVVARADLGTLNHVALTVSALRARGIEPTGLVIGSWPREPSPAQHGNRDDLPRVSGVPLAAVIPEGAGALAPAEFTTAAPAWFVPGGGQSA
jgi:dethiobiotin synthetase